jgi:pyruvate formate lyase activating enzyme
MDWRKTSRVAKYWRFDERTNKTVCLLCPRHCRRSNGEFGFCGVRGNVNNEVHTYIYGRTLAPTIENIETEAVNHYSPGAKILSLGNIGCMMDCNFCQNWTTSQVKYLDDSNVFEFTPEQVVDMAQKNNVGVISFTYNDPVVWQEFVVDTARLAKKYGIKSLYKSALYIELEPLRELIEVIDIFSISSKSLSDDFYRKYTKGKLNPVLEGIKEIYKSKRHLEISRLIVPGLNDTEAETVNIVKWMLENTDSSVPLHFVAFHPSYKYLKVFRTSIDTLLKAREYALNNGMEYVYIGNKYSSEFSDTSCKNCGNKLVERFGLSVHIVGITKQGMCNRCGSPTPIKYPFPTSIGSRYASDYDFTDKQSFTFAWNEENNGLHCHIDGLNGSKVLVKIEHKPTNETEIFELDGIDRFSLSKKHVDESSVLISFDTAIGVKFLPLLDRAHFPVM